MIELTKLKTMRDMDLSRKDRCAVCKETMRVHALYYIYGPDDDKPICGACLCDEYQKLKYGGPESICIGMEPGDF